MKDFSGVKFLGAFRDYQKRVLDNSSTYLTNNKIHIVAAPGGGKTILGLELIRRLNSPCLVLSPTNTIKFQWGERFEELFLPKGESVNDYVSFDLKNIRPITSITYQALYSAVEKVSCEDEDGEALDFSDIDLMQTIKLYDIKTICVDEAHHLQNKWQKALEKFMSRLDKKVKVIALTATPPYDATETEWSRYIDICGEIDEEIFVTELVKAKNLCPHQDYVYLNFPTLEESEYFKEYSLSVAKCMEELSSLKPLVKFGAEIFSTRSEDFISNERENFINVFGLLKYLKVPFEEKRAKKLLRQKEFESSLVVCEKALNYLLENDYLLTLNIKGQINTLFKKFKLLEKDKVKLILNGKLEKTMTYSLGKLESITKIVNCELSTLKNDLRLLVLTDFIREKDKGKIGTSGLFKDISVVSIFETIRRRFPNEKMGILSGTFAVFPSTLESKIRKLIENKKDSLKCTPLGETGYSEFDFRISNKEKVRVIGKIFEEGLINILVGTKSLLGEGWDSPCINSLILASYVGSFMLSNQMRGRAIRVYKKDAGKTANIWHLVTLNPSYANKDASDIIMTEDTSSDYRTLRRRFDCFVGPHYEKKSIQNGISRVSILKDFMNIDDLKNINAEMETRAKDRVSMTNHWLDDSVKSDQMYLETSIPYERVKSRSMSWLSVPNALLCAWLLWFSMLLSNKYEYSVLSRLSIVIFSITTMFYVIKISLLLFRINFVKMVANAILKCLINEGAIKVKSKLKIKNNFKNKSYDVMLVDNNIKEQNVFSNSLSEFFTFAGDSRYIVAKSLYSKPIYRYSFQIPKELDKNRAMVKDFTSKLFLLKGYKIYYLKNKNKLARMYRRYTYLLYCSRKITIKHNSE